MRIAITGGTGFVGKALTDELLRYGHTVFILTRNSKQHESGKQNLYYIQWLNEGDNPAHEMEELDVVINLAGESINSGRWTEERKARILKSRINATEEVLKIIKNLSKKPHTLINASAIGYYGTSNTAVFNESNTEAGNDFLATTVKRWEEKAAEANEEGVRTVFCRFGIILDKDEGALPQMVLPYKLFAGGTVGTGEQWVSWIHLDDVVSAIIFAMENESLNDAVNCTAPNPVRMKEFGEILGSVLHRPHWIPAPSFALKLILGEMSDLVLKGQKVIPSKLTEKGFSFKYPTLKDALVNIYSE